MISSAHQHVAAHLVASSAFVISCSHFEIAPHQEQWSVSDINSCGWPQVMLTKIETIIPPFKLLDIREALAGVPYEQLLAFETKNFAETIRPTTIYRGVDSSIDFVPAVKVELYVSQGVLADAAHAIETASKSSRFTSILIKSEIIGVMDGCDNNRPCDSIDQPTIQGDQ